MKRMGTYWARCISRNERGSGVLIVGLFLILLLFVGMAVDFGTLLRYRRAMQNSCDSAVLAGAQDLQSTTRQATATAQAYAQRDLIQNNIAWNPGNFSAQTQDANGNATGTNPVRLWASYQATVPLFFLASASPSVTIKVQCAAQRVPVMTTGVRPVGLNYQTFRDVWDAQGGVPCSLFGAGGNPFGVNAVQTCGDCYLTFGGTTAGSNTCGGQSPGPGNMGALDLQNAQAGCDNQGANNWNCTFVNGTGTNPLYCAGPDNTNQSSWPECSTVYPKTGNFEGPFRTAIKAVCSTPPPIGGTDAQNKSSQWVVIMPLMNSALWESALGSAVNGKSTAINIVGFAAFELDCPAMSYGNNIPKDGGTYLIPGTFVSILDTQAGGGNPNGTDTGVDTIILVQ